MKTHSERRGQNLQTDGQSVSLTSQKPSLEQSVGLVSSGDGFYVSIPVKDEKDKAKLEKYVSRITTKKGFVKSSRLKGGSFMGYAIITILSALLGAGASRYSDVKSFCIDTYNNSTNYAINKLQQGAKTVLKATGDTTVVVDKKGSIDAVVNKELAPVAQPVDSSGRVNEVYTSAAAVPVKDSVVPSAPVVNASVDPGVANNYVSLIRGGNFVGAKEYQRQFGKKIPLNFSTLSDLIDKFGDNEEFVKNVLVNHSHNREFLDRLGYSADYTAKLNDRCAKFDNFRIWK